MLYVLYTCNAGFPAENVLDTVVGSALRPGGGVQVDLFYLIFTQTVALQPDLYKESECSAYILYLF